MYICMRLPACLSLTRLFQGTNPCNRIFPLPKMPFPLWYSGMACPWHAPGVNRTHFPRNLACNGQGGGMYDRRLSGCVLVSMIMMEFLFISFISSQEVQHVSTHLPNLQQIHGFRRSISHLNSPGVLCAIAQTKEHFFLFHFSSGKWRFTSFFCFWLHCRLFFLVNPGRCPNPPFFCFFFPRWWHVLGDL